MCDLVESINILADAILLSLRQQGSRLTRAQMCERLGITNKTLAKRLIKKEIPQPLKDGKWLLADVIEFELQAKRGY